MTPKGKAVVQRTPKSGERMADNQDRREAKPPVMKIEWNANEVTEEDLTLAK